MSGKWDETNPSQPTSETEKTERSQKKQSDSHSYLSQSAQRASSKTSRTTPEETTFTRQGAKTSSSFTKASSVSPSSEEEIGTSSDSSYDSDSDYSDSQESRSVTSTDVRHTTRTETASGTESSSSWISTEYSTGSLEPTQHFEVKHPRRNVIFVRTGERVDRIFPRWFKDSLTEKGIYIPGDINLPIKLPQRSIGDFLLDGPITQVGQVTSQMLGRAIRMKRRVPDIVVSSPALRCVQTAHNIIRFTKAKDAQIRIEPGLFEWTKWYPQLPNFMSNTELVRAGYSVSQKYTPIVSAESLKEEESIPDLYIRIQNTIKTVIEERFPQSSVLFVGHAVTLDAGARQLIGKGSKDQPRNEIGMKRQGLFYPYNTSVVVRQRTDPHLWRLKHSAIPHLDFSEFTNHVDTQYLTR